MTPETVAILISWAAMLSGYPMPDHPIAVEFRDHSFFVDMVCGGQECNVVGTFLDEDDPYTLYIDKRFEWRVDMAALSIVVHEASHALQWYSGMFDTNNCEHSLQRERSAYFFQNEFLVRNGSAPILHMTHGTCAKGPK